MKTPQYTYILNKKTKYIFKIPYNPIYKLGINYDELLNKPCIFF